MTNQHQGYYRYDPTVIGKGEPGRIFPYMGEDGTLAYFLESLGVDLIESGKVSPPWLLLLQQGETSLRSLKESWMKLSTLFVDLEVFQSDWFNFKLPPGEQFSSEFVQERKKMGEAVAAAKNAVKAHGSEVGAYLSSTQRRLFYTALKEKGYSSPLATPINQEPGLSDREFSRYRLASPNPMSLRGFLPEDQPWLQSLTLPGNSLDLSLAASQGHLFILDYPTLENLTLGDLQNGRYVGSPKTLFYGSQTGLKPLLIQLEKGGKVFTPSEEEDGDSWMKAKLFVQVADTTQHELLEHLCYTHLAMEAFAIATRRNLPATHPLHPLLTPHFQFLLAINTRGNEILLNEGAAIDNLMAPTRDASLRLINQAYRARPFTDYALPNNIKRRGLGKDILADFPYRDDAQLLWQAITKYVTNYLKLYYRNDQEVQKDNYLQNWIAELGHPLNTRPLGEFPQAPWWLPQELIQQTSLSIDSLPNYPRVPGLPIREIENYPLGGIASLEDLITIITTIIFICGPQHAAINFNQFDYLGYVPNHPFAAYANPDSATFIADILPPSAQEIGQMELTFALSAIRWGQLGSSDLIKFVDSLDRQCLAKFQADLQSIEREIKGRNQERLVKEGFEYSYLLPSRIPNSINI